MKARFRLKELVEQGLDAIAATSPVLGRGLAELDCSEVDSLTPDELQALFFGIPPEMSSLDKLGQVIDSATVSDSLGIQFLERLGEAPVSLPGLPTPSSVADEDEENQSFVLEAEVSARPLHPIKVLEQVTQEYRNYLRTEFRAKDPELKAALETALDEPLFLAQEPFFQAHRPFKAGQPWKDLPIDARLARALAKRSNSDRAYLHQSQAISHLLGANASPLVVTTGTGSGKTESFLVPVIQNAIEDAVLFKHPGLTAILVYPMNALANDQLQRIEDYLQESGWAGAIKIAKYDRSTRQKEREELRQNPPHILLTNYMMLEYLLVRPADRDGIFANHRCRFLVLDEVHTYRGTLGSNIALLVRRLRQHLNQARQDWNSDPAEALLKRYPTLLPIGTSATIKSVTGAELSPEQRLRERDNAVQGFFSKLTGAESPTIRVIGEELEEIQIPAEATYPQDPVVVANLDENDPASVHQAICALGGQSTETPLNEVTRHTRILWDLNQWLIQAPMSLGDIVKRVKTEVPERQHQGNDLVRQEVETALVAGAAMADDVPGTLRLRSHRLIRGGWQFHRCVNPNCGKLYPMGEERCDCGSATAPLFLCRNCGAHYLRFVGDDPTDPTQGTLRPSAIAREEHEWLIYDANRFPDTINQDDSEEEGQASSRGRGSRRQTQQMRQRPVLNGSFDIHSLAFSERTDDYTWPVTLIPARTRCLCCGGTAGSRNVISAVALGTSAAVKVLAEGLVEALGKAHQGDPNHDGKERLLIFSDSRQDAAHQARFITFASRYDRMRRRLLQILKEKKTASIQDLVTELGARGVQEGDNPHAQGSNYDWLPEEVKKKVYAWEEAPLLDEISVNAGYRATLINLGLVGVSYHRLDEYVQEFGGPISAQLRVTKEQLTYICRCLLDEIRVRGCLSRELLKFHPANTRAPQFIQAAEWERKVKNPRGYALANDGSIQAFMDGAEVPSGITSSNPWRRLGAGGRSPSLQRILQHLVLRFGGTSELDSDTMVKLLEMLQEPGKFLTAEELHGFQDSKRLLQVNDQVVRLNLVEDAERQHCHICGIPMPGKVTEMPCPSCQGQIVPWSLEELLENHYIQRIQADTTVPLIAEEHTAQVPNDKRIEIEQSFKAKATESKLNVLACSPTLEMGIDVGGLDAVIMRNVPPRPDNYAQRGGRAGRRSRVGLVISYARSTPHDQYFYDKPAEMISGEVPAPALALGNRDVIFRHLNAIAFGAAEPGLAGRMMDYVSPNGEINQEAVNELIHGVEAQKNHAIAMALHAWESTVLEEAELDEAALQSNLDKLPEQIQDVINRTARQVQELRQALEAYSEELKGRQAAIRAGDLISRLLGIPPERNRSGTDADDRSAGYPLRRFAEFGLLPGYEFPTQPASVRLLGDSREEDPISVDRRFGINQFRPEAQVYARTRRWRVMGLDTSSPWNPRTDEPTWVYRQCRVCDLRFDAAEPCCPRCKDDSPNRELPAYEFAGFIARRDEGPILDEEERYAARNLVKLYPQWNKPVRYRWSTGPGWGLRLSQNEEVCWVNEGPEPTPRERETLPLLHAEAKGYSLCSSCGKLLKPEETNNTQRGRRQTRSTRNQADQFGHAQNCRFAGQSPKPVAIVTAHRAEVLRLMIPIPLSMDLDKLRSWGISLGYALKAGMQHCYMLDGSEIDFEFEGPWKAETEGRRHQIVSLTFIDPSLGGSGYLRRIATEFNLVAQKALEHLDHPNCETACYRCLKTYQNQRYHELLAWPQVIPDLEILSQIPPKPRPLEIGDLNDPGPWLEAYEAGVGSPLELRFLRLFEKHGFHPAKQVPVSANPDELPISIADFAVPERKLAIYVDGSSFHQGGNLRRDRFIRNKLQEGQNSWRVIELTAKDLRKGENLVITLQAAES